MFDWPIDYKPISYKNYIDDSFLLFLSELQVTKFSRYTNSKHGTIFFTVKLEVNNSLSFIDIIFFRDIGTLYGSVYRKFKFSGVLTNFKSC